jgi:hypothetical protein
MLGKIKEQLVRKECTVAIFRIEVTLTLKMEADDFKFFRE